MKAQHTNTTPTMTPAWGRQSVVALTVLIALVVIGIGLVYAPRLFSRTSADTTVRSVAQPFIANCRICRMRAGQCRQVNQRATSAVSRPARIATQPFIANCRICRDEALGAVQASLTAVDVTEPVPQPADPRQSGPR